MKGTNLTNAVEQVVALKMAAIDELIGKMVEPLEQLGSPEKLIGKPYSQWDANDLQRLTQIYGSGDDTILANLVFRRELEKVKQMEAEEL